MTDSPSRAACRREIEALHDFFVAWYTRQTEAFERMEAVIAPAFEMVTPDGARLDRETTLGMVRDGRGDHDSGTFDIDVRNVEVLDTGHDHAVVRYEEHQTTPEGDTGRISTVLFRTDADAPNGLVWVTVHETWLDS